MSVMVAVNDGHDISNGLLFLILIWKMGMDVGELMGEEMAKHLR